MKCSVVFGSRTGDGFDSDGAVGEARGLLEELGFMRSLGNRAVVTQC